MFDLHNIFAADATPWYQDFGFWGLFLGVVGGCIGGTWALIHFVQRERRHRVEEERKQLNEQLQTANHELEQLRRNQGNNLQELQRKLNDSQHQADQAESERDRLQRIVNGLNQNLRIAKQMEGHTWLRAPTSEATPFQPLSQRQPPIIAVLNLKGGVGKTTVAANLAAAYARAGSRVLLVDLDLQASLTSLYFSAEELDQRFRERRLIQHFLEESIAGRGPRFLDFIRPTDEPNIELIGTSDTLAYAELNLTVHWLLRPSQVDARLIMRGGLHDVDCWCRYDIVVIDCPPLLNVSCVNALSAADYLLVPTILSRASAERVPTTLAWLQRLRQNLNPSLKMLGVAANRTQVSTGMSAAERDIWSTLGDQCHESWGEPVPMCEAFIPQNVAIRNAENARRPLDAGDATFSFFESLAAELAERIPPANRPTIASGVHS